MNKSRELFEFHVTNDGKVPAPARKGDGYLSNHFNAMWIGWLASRSVKIEVPNEYPDDRDWQAGYNLCIEDCKSAITNAGHEYK